MLRVIQKGNCADLLPSPRYHPAVVPALRDRCKDIAGLADHFWPEASAKHARECAVLLQGSVKLHSAASDSPLVDEPTWVFEREAQHLELRRRETGDGTQLVIVGDGAPRSYRFDEMTALVNFQSDMETLLLKTGWSFVEFSPERRTGKERRTWPRLTERRRWWTDGQLWRLLGVGRARKDR